jgi:cytochrome c-type biogenesis protein CcmF
VNGKKIKFSSASVSHIGFGLVLIGILLSSAKKTVLSENTTGIFVFKKDKKEDPAENITLFKGVPTQMGKYMVTYVRDTFNTDEKKQYFEIDFIDKNNGEHFALYPDLMKYNKGMEGMSANPAAKHYLSKDIFVYISAYELNKQADTASYRSVTIKQGDTIYYSNGLIVFNKVERNPQELSGGKFNSNEQSLFFNFTVQSKYGRQYTAMPGLAFKDSSLRLIPDTVPQENLALRFNKLVNPKNNTIEIGIKESSAVSDLITLKVYEFPWIIILWIGVIIMSLGFVLAIYKRTIVDSR